MTTLFLLSLFITISLCLCERKSVQNSIRRYGYTKLKIHKTKRIKKSTGAREGKEKVWE